MFGNNLVLTSGVTHNLSCLPSSADEYFVTGSATLAAATVIQLDPAETPQKWDRKILYYKAVIALGTGSLTIFGLALNKEQAAKESTITCIYDGAAWIVHILMDASDLPSGVTSATTTVLAAPGLVKVIDPDIDSNYQIYTGSATLAGSVSVTQGGTPKIGQMMWCDYRATLTQGANTVTLFGQLLTDEQALVGGVLVYTVYNGSSWNTTLIKSAIGVGDLWEPGSAGTGSCTRITATTGCDATGDYSLASGKDSLASGAYSVASGNACTASGIASHAQGNATTASGASSTAEGEGSIASGNDSHAEGYFTTASGDASHAEGSETIASGVNSHAQGVNTIASGDGSRASGNGAVAPYYGSSAHASGPYTIKGDCQGLKVVLKVITTNATPTNLQLGDNTDGITIPTDCTANVSIRLVSVQSAGAAGTIGDTFAQNLMLAVKNIAGVSALIGTVAVLSTKNDVAFAGTVAVTVAANKIQITATGEANKTLQWAAEVEMVMVGYRNFTI